MSRPGLPRCKLQAFTAPIAIALVLACSPLLATAVQAADELVLIEITEAMGTAEYQSKLDGSVQFYFGDTPHPPVVHAYGTFVTNKKTNGFLKAAGDACRHVLLSALLSLQSQAKSLGGNAVVNIKSYFKSNEVSRDREAECYKGFLMAGVALKGEVVKLGQ